MKAKMSLDGIQEVEVPIENAIIKALKKLDQWNYDMLNGIMRSLVYTGGKITKADYDYVLDYLRSN